jgi:hypothetical protein
MVSVAKQKKIPEYEFSSPNFRDSKILQGPETLDESVKIRVCQIKFPMELAWQIFPQILKFYTFGSNSFQLLNLHKSHFHPKSWYFGRKSDFHPNVFFSKTYIMINFLINLQYFKSKS